MITPKILKEHKIEGLQETIYLMQIGPIYAVTTMDWDGNSWEFFDDDELWEAKAAFTYKIAEEKNRLEKIEARQEEYFRNSPERKKFRQALEEHLGSMTDEELKQSMVDAGMDPNKIRIGDKDNA